MEIDSFTIDAGHKQSIQSKPNRANHCHFGGIFGDGHTINPPFDEEELQEVDEQRVHHSYPEDDGVGVLQC